MPVEFWDFKRKKNIVFVNVRRQAITSFSWISNKSNSCQKIVAIEQALRIFETSNTKSRTRGGLVGWESRLSMTKDGSLGLSLCLSCPFSHVWVIPSHVCECLLVACASFPPLVCGCFHRWRFLKSRLLNVQGTLNGSTQCAGPKSRLFRLNHDHWSTQWVTGSSDRDSSP